MTYGASGKPINTEETCVYSPACAASGGLHCFEQTGCKYQSSLGAAVAAEETVANATAGARRLGSCTADAKPCTALGQPQLWCFQDPSCPGGGYNGGQGCIEDSGCRYCDATAMNGPSYDGEACPSPAPSPSNPCGSLSQTDPAPCPMTYGASGKPINTVETCVYSPACARSGGLHCFEQTGCKYQSSLGAAVAAEEAVANATAGALRLGSCTSDAKPCTALGQPQFWCFQDPSCPGGGYNGGQGCIGDSGCRYCDATAMNGPSYDGEACPSPAPSPSNPCESLSKTDPAPCPMTYGASGKPINTEETCVYSPACAASGGLHCFEQTGCKYKSSLGAAVAAEETVANATAGALRLGSCTSDAKPCTALGQPHIWCFQDPSCPGGGYNGGQGCIGDSGCRYCDATAMNGPSYDG